MTLLTVNAGSSSVRLALYSHGAPPRRAAVFHGPGTAPPLETLRQFIGEHKIFAVAHRIVHGGTIATKACLVDAATEQTIEAAGRLAPLHNPVALTWIRACRDLLSPGTPNIAVFDTAYYAHLPEVAATYALPQALCAEHAIRRYGFHGLAHEAMWRGWRVRRGRSTDDERVISLQLGAGCSVTASRGGQALDTSMGFSPLEGLAMATRCGDIDAGLLLYLLREHAQTPQQLETLLNRQSGLLGISGISADMRQLLASPEPRARLAVDVFCYRARKYIGAFLAVLGGADAIIFGGGIGENAPAIRAKILAQLEWAGIALDDTRNDAAIGVEARIGTADSPTDIWVQPVDEMTILAEAGQAVLDQTSRLATGST